ncbi:LCP family protein [Actinacidiphila epipremni]|uniref:LCP family protein n=1 Tax=Actinacidiphila epipremni TaxID=2053013 RepID=UPI002B002EEA|nr:LCP family protein [Actinacidiphila epipremni]
MSTEEPGYVDPADQWVLDPVTGMYELRLDVPPQRQEQAQEYGGQPESAPDAYGQGTAAQGGYEAQGTYDPYASYGSYESGDQHSYDAGEQHSPYGTGESSAYGTGGQPASYDTGEQPAQDGHDAPVAPPAPAWAPEVPPTPPAPQTAAEGGGRRTGAPQGRAGRRKAKPAKGGAAALLGQLPGGPVVWGVGAACAVLLVGGIASVAALGGGGGPGLHTVDLAGAGAKEPVHTGAMNVLLLNSHPAAGASTDSAVLVHLSADRGDITALAIPPAMVTDIPDCPAATGGGTVKGAKAQPFSASLTGGRDAGCALRTVKQLTGLAVDHVVAVDYAAVKGGTKDIAAADRCVDRTITVPRTLTALARTAPSAVTADSPLGTPETMSNLAAALGAVAPQDTTFVAMPVTGTGASAAPDKDKASQIYALLANDVSLTGAQSAASDPKLTGPKAKPHDTRVEIYNGTGVFGASQDVLAWLQNTQGVDRSTNGGDAHGKVAKTTLQYAPNQADQARSLAAMMGLPASALVQGTKDAAPRANMTLTLGADYTKPGAPIGPPTAPPKDVKLTPGTAAHC